MRLTGLGGSIGTGPEGITAEVLVVRVRHEYTRNIPKRKLVNSTLNPCLLYFSRVSPLQDYNDLQQYKQQANGRIVLFNVEFPAENGNMFYHYGKTVRYRSNGAVWAAEVRGSDGETFFITSP